MKKLLILLIIIVGCKKDDTIQPTNSSGTPTPHLYSRYYLYSNSGIPTGLVDTITISSGRISKLVTPSTAYFGETYPITLSHDSVSINSWTFGGGDYIQSYTYGLHEYCRVDGDKLHLNFCHKNSFGTAITSWFLLTYKAF